MPEKLKKVLLNMFPILHRLWDKMDKIYLQVMNSKDDDNKKDWKAD